MKDLYKHLGVEETATADAIRAACPRAPQEVRSAAEYILLDDHRRRVYDRNRSLLVSLGQLRSKLGLSFAPFWVRGSFAEFTFDPLLKFPTPQTTHDGQHLADPLEVLRAFDGGARRRRRSRRWASKSLIAFSILILLATLAALVFLWWQSYQNVTL